MCYVAVFAQHRGDSIDCGNRIGYSWMKSIAYEYVINEIVNDVAVDDDGNIYFAGTYFEESDAAVPNAGTTYFFIGKKSPDGTLLWMKNSVSSGAENTINSIAVDANGNVYAVGLANAGTSFDGNNFQSNGQKDGFLLKLDTDGNFQYSRTIGSFNNDNALDVVVDNENKPVVTGNFDFLLQVSQIEFYQYAMGNDDTFMLKFNEDGSLVWSTTFASTSKDYGRRLACDNNNNIYLAGEFQSTLSQNGISIYSPDDRNVYLAKFNSAGTIQWAVQCGTTGNDSVTALDVTPEGDVFLAYKYEDGTPFVAKYSTSGTLLETMDFTGAGSLAIKDIMCDLHGNMYMTGEFSGQIDFATGVSLTSQGTTPDFFIVRYDNTGTLNLNFTGNQQNENALNALALDYANNLIGGGYYSSSITFGDDTEISNGEEDGLIIKFERYISFGQTTISNIACDSNNMGVSIDVEGGEQPFLYYWSNGSNQSSLSGISAGTYSLTVVDNANCYITTSVTLEPPQPPTVNLQSNVFICPNDSTTISVNTGFSEYLWNTGATSNEITVSQAGNYSVTITADNSCTASATTNVSQYPNLDILPNSDYYFCPGEFLTIEAQGFESYYWSNGENTSTFTTPIEYTFWVRAYDGICYYYDTLTTHKYPQPNIELGNDVNFCEGDSVQISAPAGFNNYSWSNGAVGQTIWANTEGYLKVSAEDENSCSAIDSVFVNSIEAPKLDLGNDTTYCTDGKVLLESETTCENCTYLWSTGETSGSIAVTTTGSYWVSAINEFGCANADTIHINVVRVATIGLPDELSFCEEYATLSPEHSFQSYEWSTGETTRSIDIYYSGLYSLTITDVNGCSVSDSVSATKLYITEPFLGNDTVFCGLQTRRLTLNATYTTYIWNNGTENQYIDISNPGGYYSVSVTNSVGCTASTSMNASFTENYPTITKITSGKGLVIVDVEGGVPPYYYSADGENWQSSNIFDGLPSAHYNILVMDNNSCTDQMNTFLDASIGVPSFFTPNGDGFNDTWIITGLYLYPNSKVAVYDRYGKELFVSKGPNCEWDGIYAGDYLPSDSYWYVIYLNEEVAPMKGSVTIKR